MAAGVTTGRRSREHACGRGRSWAFCRLRLGRDCLFYLCQVFRRIDVLKHHRIEFWMLRQVNHAGAVLREERVDLVILCFERCLCYWEEVFGVDRAERLQSTSGACYRDYRPAGLRLLNKKLEEFRRYKWRIYGQHQT